MSGHPWPLSRIARIEGHVGRSWENQDEAALRSALTLEKHPVDLWHTIGHAARGAEKLEEALEAYGEAIAFAARYHPLIHFEHSAMLLKRATLYHEAGDEEAAGRDVTAALFQDHTNVAALFLRQHGYRQGERLPDYTACAWSRRDAEAQLQRIPVDAVVLSAYEEALDAATADWRKGSARQAEAAYRLLKKDAPDDPFVLHRLAWVSEGGEGMEAITRAVTLWAEYHRTYHRGGALHYLHRGEVYRRMGEDTLARMDFIRARDMDVSFSEPLAALGETIP